MASHKCRECDIVYDNNPRRCRECGNTILTPVSDKPKKKVLGVDLTDSELTEEQIRGENIKTDDTKFLDKLRFWK